MSCPNCSCEKCERCPQCGGQGVTPTGTYGATEPCLRCFSSGKRNIQPVMSSKDTGAWKDYMKKVFYK